MYIGKLYRVVFLRLHSRRLNTRTISVHSAPCVPADISSGRVLYEHHTFYKRGGYATETKALVVENDTTERSRETNLFRKLLEKGTAEGYVKAPFVLRVMLRSGGISVRKSDARFYSGSGNWRIRRNVKRVRVVVISIAFGSHLLLARTLKINRPFLRRLKERRTSIEYLLYIFPNVIPFVSSVRVYIYIYVYVRV